MCWINEVGHASIELTINRRQFAGLNGRAHPMTKSIPGSMRTRESLLELVEGRLSAPDARTELVRLATRLIVEEALEAESRDALGRDCHVHGASPG